MIFLYHGVIPDDSPAERLCVGQALTQSAFKSQIKWLAGHYRIVSLDEYLAGMQRPGFLKERPVAITFDDGFKITFENIFPFLMDKEIPVTIFTTTGHLEHGEILWFSYLKALCFENTYDVIQAGEHTFPIQNLKQRIHAWENLHGLAGMSGDPVLFGRELSKIYPLPREVIELYEGMTYEQVRMAGASRHIDLGAHTVTHPYLDQISTEKQKWEIQESGRNLSKWTEKAIRYFAYPSGEYNLDTLNLVKDAGYTAAFAVASKKLGMGSNQFEIGRVGIYSPSLVKLRLKAIGISDLMQRFYS